METLEAPNTTRVPPVGAFRQIGWAFLFLGLSVGPHRQIGQEFFLIDLFPDFVGYLMIATAASRLVPFHGRALAIRNMAFLLTFVTIPTAIQYSVVTSQSQGITKTEAPLWPLSAASGLLDLVLVWMLCGLVADLARRADDRVTEDRARMRRVVYVLLRIIMAVGLGLILVSPTRELIVGGAIAALGGGLVLMVLMMGLMNRAEVLWRAWPEVAGPDTGARPGGWAASLLTAAGVILPIFLAIGGFYYYTEWQDERDRRSVEASSSTFFSTARDDFFEPLKAGRIDDAYAATTESFKKRISRGQFDELVGKYNNFEKDRHQHRGGGASSSSSGETLTEQGYFEIDDGRVMQMTVTYRGDRDSVLYRTPPPVRVDDFNVEEWARPAQPFGWPKGPGR